MIREGGYTMGVGSVTSTNSMSGMQTAAARSTDSESKSIQNEIAGVQQQMQKLSSEEEISYGEKANERKKLQKEISGLNEELKRHEEELRRAQQREILLAELREEQKAAEEKPSEDEKQTKTADIEKTDEKKLPIDKQQSEKAEKNKPGAIAKEEAQATGSDRNINVDLSDKEMQAVVSADVSAQQAKQQGTVITRIQEGIVILKGEIKQDEQRGVDTEKKQAELERMEKREQRAREMQTSVLGGANNTVQSTAKANETEAQNRTWVNTENSAFQLSGENQKSQQMFYVSLTS